MTYKIDTSLRKHRSKSLVQAGSKPIFHGAQLRRSGLRLGRKLDRYAALGLGFALFGGPFAVFAFTVLLSVPLTSLGIACVVLGASLALVPESPVPKQTIRAMVEGSCAGVESVLEEFNAKERAVYMPPRDGRVVALIPYGGDPGVAWRARDVPLRVLGEVEGQPALMVWPPGSEIVRLSLLGEESGVEEALSYVLVDSLEAVEGVKSVEAGRRFVVSISKPRIRTDFPRFNRCLGSLATSISGCVLAQVTGKPVALVEELVSGESINATFEVPREPEQVLLGTNTMSTNSHN